MERLPLPAAARRLGLSSVAVRKRAQRGTLAAEKVEGQWFIFLPGASADPAHGRPDGPAARTAQQNGPSVLPDGGQAAQMDHPAVDMAATVELGVIAREALAQVARERELRSQSEQAAAMWQERARNLEGEVERLQAQLVLPAHAETSLAHRPWWRRLFGSP